MSKKINLSDLAHDITLEEGGEESISVAQVREVLGILGRRWREAVLADAVEEFMSIRERAGLRT